MNTSIRDIRMSRKSKTSGGLTAPFSQICPRPKGLSEERDELRARVYSLDGKIVAKRENRLHTTLKDNPNRGAARNH